MLENNRLIQQEWRSQTDTKCLFIKYNLSFWDVYELVTFCAKRSNITFVKVQHKLLTTDQVKGAKTN